METAMRYVHPRAAVVAAISLLAVAAPVAGLDIQLPPDSTSLRPGVGSDLAARQCATCHSADYVAIQPPGKPLAFWKAEVEKMKKVYGAPIPDEAIDPIARYLTREYGDGK
jgi:sulfite dehydrogenase (cytochrome) subunit B